MLAMQAVAKRRRDLFEVFFWKKIARTILSGPSAAVIGEKFSVRASSPLIREKARHFFALFPMEGPQVQIRFPPHPSLQPSVHARERHQNRAI
jgi:hypothetical protein